MEWNTIVDDTSDIMTTMNGTCISLDKLSISDMYVQTLYWAATLPLLFGSWMILALVWHFSTRKTSRRIVRQQRQIQKLVGVEDNELAIRVKLPNYNNNKKPQPPNPKKKMDSLLPKEETIYSIDNDGNDNGTDFVVEEEEEEEEKKKDNEIEMSAATKDGEPSVTDIKQQPNTDDLKLSFHII